MPRGGGCALIRVLGVVTIDPPHVALARNRERFTTMTNYDDGPMDAAADTPTDAPSDTTIEASSAADDAAESKPRRKTSKTSKKKAAKKASKKTKKKAVRKKTTRKKVAAKAEPEAEVEDDTPDTEAVAEADVDDEIEPEPEADIDDDEPDLEPEASDDDDDSDEDDDAEAEDSTDDDESDDDDDTDDEEAASKPRRKRRRRSRRKKSDDELEVADPRAPGTRMLVNYVPGEDCRIAIVENGQLEEFHSEPTTAISRVGNIYVGKVTNVESAIQAAFVDFGVGENGFLHISDLHPQYFPGADDDTTERVGKKVPRRSRPPIQEALKRGQEITVQVLKEGIGTKGPTLTSYLSIPGRFLVMMPQMDKVGVSRKEEDDDKRREARKILDQLELPEGFGFILRTAGFDRTKTELKRDLAYLQRLWKDMERRRKGGKRPRLLYSESDLLVRSLRDLLNTEIGEVVIDSEAALQRAARFMKIVSPRSQANLTHYTGTRPLFHAFDIEQQIKTIHAREVPLPSGGRLVIDETEALVAIDVNSGRSRRASDAETNAYQTNKEAVDAICRQLRLRDLGGLVIHDLIDMRHASHRKDIENRFKERLKRDRAKTTILPISSFGIMEMTRQRMRGSQEMVHFSTCPSCRGRGLLQKPDSVAADALRDLAALLDHERVFKVELVVSARVAGALLSTRRRGLARVEHRSGKTVDVRVSDAIAPDRYGFYAYDDQGADIDLEKLPRQKRKPEIKPWDDGEIDIATEGADESFAADMKAEAEEALHAQATAEQVRHTEATTDADEPHPIEVDPDDAADEDDDGESGGKKKRKRRRRRRRKSDGDAAEGSESSNESPRDGQAESSDDDTDSGDATSSDADGDLDPSDTDEDGEGGGKKKRRRRRRRRRKGSGDSEGGEHRESDDASPSDESSDESSDDTSDNASDDTAGKSKRTYGNRRRGRSKNSDAHTETHTETKPEPKSGSATESKPESKPDSNATPAAKPKKKFRPLYGAGRRTLSPGEAARADRD